MNIDDKQIQYAEKIFLPKGKKFCEQRRNVLKHMNRCDIIACPGSGKTTVLLAKLTMLEQQLPLKNNRGICVLTHTNIAIDEIKERLGEESSRLFAYPNFFGTIQSFVNKFLAIPYYQKTYGHRVRHIDNTAYNTELLNAFGKLEKGIRFGLLKKYEGYDFIGKMTSIRFDLHNNRLIEGISGKPLYKSISKTEIALSEMKNKIMEDGILCYDDAYWLAYKLLNEDAGIMQDLISSRFAYVFIDEMQDTAVHQSNIFDKLFDKEKVVIQRFGDPNQAIYDSINSTEQGWVICEDTLNISNSMRFSNSIANAIKPLELYPTNMSGNDTEISNPPIIFTFTKEKTLDVLPTFAQVIKERIHLAPDKRFKAIGRVGKDKKGESLSIPSYYPNYNSKKKSLANRMIFSHMVSKSTIDPDNKCGVRLYKKTIIDAILRVLWLLQIKTDNDKHYTKSSFINMLSKTNSELYDKLNHFLFKWCLDLKNSADIKSEFIEFTKEMTNTLYNIKDLTPLDKFFQEIAIDEVSKNTEENVFIYELDDEEEIRIDISTIHGVKGETHNATLYLETFFYKNDVEEIIQYLKGSTKKKTGKRLPETCKMAYVGMSRPSELLCIAARKESISDYEQDLKDLGWEIIEI